MRGHKSNTVFNKCNYCAIIVCCKKSYVGIVHYKEIIRERQIKNIFTRTKSTKHCSARFACYAAISDVTSSATNFLFTYT